MAEETRYYGGGAAPDSRPAGAPLGLAETEVAATAFASRPGAAAPASAVVPVVELAAPVELAPGTEVGEYRVTCKLGEGGMGSVYAGQQPAIGKRVAIKVLAPHYARDIELVRRFLDEARAVNLIHHPHIVDIFSFGELPGPRQYFVMEYLDGESLADAIEHERLRPDETRRLLRQMCGALAATHRVGIVHRDLKPENIWIARPPHGESYVKLLDFGIAKLLDPTRTNLTQTGAVMGTPLYMSPEQCLGREVGPATDIYAMGVLLYRIFTGRHPFVGTVTTELAIKHVSEAPPSPSIFRPLPAGLEALILDCLAKDPAARPASAEILGARLEEALASWPEHGMAPAERDAGAVLSTAPGGFSRLSVRDERTLPMAGRRPGRGPWLWLGVGLAVAAAVAGAWWLRRGPELAPVSHPAEPLAPLHEAKPVPVGPTAAPVPPIAVPQPPGEERGVAHSGDRARLREAKTVGRSAAARRPGSAAGYPLSSLARPAEAKPAAADIVPPAKPAPEEIAAPPPRPTRAQQRGLIDDNPLRR